jgi:predicted ATPase
MPRPDLPTSTVTFLFSDVEGSTRLLEELGAEAYAPALAEHRRLLREAFARHGGVEVDTQGDAFFVVFPTADGAVAAAAEAQHALEAGPIRVRMGLHTGTPLLTTEGYVGPDVHRAARIAAAGHGGQVLVSAATAGLLRHADLHDLGEHRLKDLSAPERIYQLGKREFPPLKTIYQTNLPVPLTSFLGRERELAELTTLLARDDVRLVTLTGPGGTGKTRLALQAAATVAESFPDGVWWVPLTPLRDPALVLASAAGVLAASGELAEHIGDKRLLLLLDNFEHLVAAAADLGALLARCPNLHAMVTSRELLQLPGEQAYPVPPLKAAEGVELFLTRALAARPDFSGDGTVAELCDRLDNLPLAIELAAARVRMLSPEQLLARLGQRLDLLKGGRGVDDRQQTLRATIEWSYDLLDIGEQSLLARLAVFRGGWTLEAAEQICDADLDVLQSLADKSLVRVRDERFSMLETIREFAEERLEVSGEAQETRRRHAEYFVAMVEQAAPQLALGVPDRLNQIEADHDNVRAAFDRSVAAGEGRTAQRLAGLLFDFWMVRGHFVEAARRAEAAIVADPTPTVELARALSASSMFNGGQSDHGLARGRAEQAIEVATALGDRRSLAHGRHALGGAAAGEEDWVTARDLWQRSLDDFTALGDDHWVLVTRRSVAHASDMLGDRARYRALVLENLEHSQRVGDRRIEARSLGSLGMWELEGGRLDRAIEHLSESLRIDRELGNPMFMAVDLVRFAIILARQAEAAAGALLIGRSEKIWDDIGATPEMWMADEHEQALSLVREHLDEQAVAERTSAGRELSLEEALEIALASKEQP